MGEFEFISQYLSQICGPEGLDLKDDIALWQPPSGKDIVMSMDTIVEGVHFPEGKFDGQIAQKLMRINISDLVAKGADPQGYLLSLCLHNEITEDQLAGFCKGLAVDQETYGLKLWGGDTTHTKGGCVLSMTIIGTVPTGKTVLRRGAKSGDILCVSGTIGDAYLGLKVLLGDLEQSSSNHWVNAYNLPRPPFDMRRKIRTFASAALDISDGLIADAGHMARVSNVGIQIEMEAIPLSKQTRIWISNQKHKSDALTELATGGDDYQVLMVLTKLQFREAIIQGMEITRIGTITDKTGVVCIDERGNEIAIKTPGYTHF